MKECMYSWDHYGHSILVVDMITVFLHSLIFTLLFLMVEKYMDFVNEEYFQEIILGKIGR